MDDSAPVPLSEPAPAPLPPLPPLVNGGRHVALLSLVMATSAAVVFWIGGFLPWVLDGFHVDAQRFGSGLSQVWLPVPLIAGQLTELVALTTVGSIAVMVLPLLFPSIPRPLAVVAAGLVLIATAVALTSIARVRLADQPHSDFASDPRVLDGLVVGMLVIVVLGVVVGGLASLQIGFLPVAAAVVVTQLLSWLALLELPRPELVAHLVTVVLLGGALVLSVRRSVGWVALWPVALLVIWMGPPLSAATTTVAGRLRPGQNLDDSLGDVYRNGWEVFRSSLGDAPRTWWPQLVALGIGAVWLVARRWAPRPDR